MAGTMARRVTSPVLVGRADAVEQRSPPLPPHGQVSRHALAGPAAADLARLLPTLGREETPLVGEPWAQTRLYEAPLYERSDGNPIYVEDLLASGPDPDDPLPTSLRDVLLSRVDAVDEWCPPPR